MANLYLRYADVINRGFSGYNSRWMKHLIQSLLLADIGKHSKTRIITLWLGANDAADETSGQHVPLIEYKENMTFIVNCIKSLIPNVVLILITPADVDNCLWPNRCTDAVSKYAEVVREISKTSDSLLVDLWIHSHGVESVTSADLNDGLHLGTSGNQKVFEKIKGSLLQYHPELIPDTQEIIKITPCILPTHFPLWSELIELSPEDVQTKIMNWKYS